MSSDQLKEEIQRIKEIVSHYEKLPPHLIVFPNTNDETLSIDNKSETLDPSELDVVRLQHREELLRILNGPQPSYEDLPKIFQLFSAENPYFFSDLFQLIVNLEISETEAEILWQDIFEHTKEMTLKLGRKVNLVAATMDYIFTKKRLVQNPKIVDALTFDQLLLHTIVDDTTGIYNRRYFNLILNTEIKRGSRYDRKFSIVLFDVDDFKMINDSQGHSAGDEALKLIGKSLIDNFRKEDLPCRIGGEEFAVLLPETDRDHAVAAANRFRKSLAEESSQTLHARITVSGGVAVFPDDGTSLDTLYKKADDLLYEAKVSGKNTIRF